MSISFAEATQSYEKWMAQRFTPVASALAYKHDRVLAANPFSFLRGTFYWWLHRWDQLMPAPVRQAPAILSVGDLHLENFGTWRDGEGRLVWGVNDFDEAGTYPVTLDLVRLATSIMLAVGEDHLSLDHDVACASLLAGYVANLDKPDGRPIILEAEAAWLRPAATMHWAEFGRFWRREFRGLHVMKDHDDLRELLIDRMPEGVEIEEFLDRSNAGNGSLGRPRAIALGQWRGGPVAREGKRTLPSASVWKSGESATADANMDYRLLLASSFRALDPWLDLTEDWIIRRLSPENHKIEVDQIHGQLEARELVWWMGWEIANIHRGQAGRFDIQDWLAALPVGWLADSARIMGQGMDDDWQDFRA